MAQLYTKSRKEIKEKGWNNASFYLSNTIWQSIEASDAIIKLKEELSDTQWKVFRAFQWMRERYQYIYPSLDLLARIARVSVSSVRRAIDKLKSLQMIEVVWRSYDSNLYYINEYFTRPDILKILRAFFVNFSLFCFSQSLLISKSAQAEHEQLLKFKENEVFNTVTVPYRVSLTRDARACGNGTGQVVKKGKEVMYPDSFALIKKNQNIWPLTDLGCMKLSVFPAGVIGKLKEQKPFYEAYDFFSWLFGSCKRMASEMGMHKVDFTQFDKTSKAMGLGAGDPLVDEKALRELKAKKTHKQGTLKPASAYSDPLFRNWSQQEKIAHKAEAVRIMKLIPQEERNSFVAAEIKSFEDQFGMGPFEQIQEQPTPISQTAQFKKLMQEAQEKGFDPEGLAYWQLNAIQRDECFCCIVTKTRGNNPACTIKNCFLTRNRNRT
jgi:hypothetical protein